jgi:predicted outer membrane repeat protein
MEGTRFPSLLVLATLLCRLSAPAQAANDTVSAAQAVQVITEQLTSNITSSGLTCIISIIASNTTAGKDTVAVASINVVGSLDVSSAAVECTGGTLKLLGGPALEGFNDSFTGVEYSRSYDLPGGTIAIKDQNLTVANSTFAGLSAFGEASIILINSTVVFQTVNFTDNMQSVAGAIRANDSSIVQVLNSTFINNSGENGGAISMYNSSLFVNASTFTANDGPQGGAILFQNGTSSNLTVANTIFERNTANTGGAIFAQDCEASILSNNVFEDNTADGSGGALFQLGCGGALISNTFRSNNATAGGGGYLNNLPSLTLQNNLWTLNTAQVGAGGLDLQSVKAATITQDVYYLNSGQQGGAIFETSTAADLFNTTFLENNSTLNGGALFRTQSSGIVSGCNFTRNDAFKLGGGMYDTQVSGNIVSTVFSKNTAGTSSASALYRQQCSGSIDSSNRGLTQGSNYQNLNPKGTSSN